MADTDALLAEAYKRGLLPPDKAALYEEAHKRGLVTASPGSEAAPATKGPSWYDKLLMGAGTPAIGGAQGMARLHLSPAGSDEGALGDLMLQRAGQPKADYSSGGVEAAVQQREKDYQAARTAAGDTGTDWWRMAGDAAMTLPLSALNPAAAGAVVGALQPETSGGNFWTQKAKDIALGAVTGQATATGFNFLAKAVAPTFRNAVTTLMGEGVKLTPGMLGGRIAKAAEDKATSIPITGDAIASSQRRAVETFNRAALNRTLQPIGEKLPPNLTAGRDAVTYAGDKISQAYDTVLPTLTFKPDAQFASDVSSLHALSSYMPPAQADQFGKILNERVLGRLVGKGGSADGQTTQQVRSELRNFARSYRSSPDAAQRQLADAVSTLDLHIGETLERGNPAAAPILKSIDSAYARLVRVEGAASRRGTSEGVFTPGDLLGSIKSADRTTRHRAFARGDALMQDFGETAQNVIGNKYPDSGTTGRRFMGEMIAGGGVATALGHPEIPVASLAAMGTGAAAYTRPAINALNAWAQPGPLRDSLALGLRKTGQYAAPMAASAQPANALLAIAGGGN